MSETSESLLQELLPFLRRVGQERHLAPAELLIEEGRHDQQIYYIVSGTTEVVRDGKVIRRVEAGDLVGEYAFIDNRPRTASVSAVGDVVVLEIDRQVLIQSAADDLGPLSKFLQVATQRMHRRSLARRGEDSEAFLERMVAEALNHRAVHHPYLHALSSGEFPDQRWALADFGRQYYGYSAHFPRYLTKTISQLTEPRHRKGLMQNLIEESGNYSDEDLDVLSASGIEREWILGVPHPELFKRFCDALGVRLGNVEEDSTEVACWREMFLDVLGEGTPAQAVGALGLGTETIVSTMYQKFLPALEQVHVDPRDAVFFPLHAIVDDHHQEALLQIASDFASTHEGRQDLTKGMRKALFLRSGFWDWLHARALDPETAANSQDGTR